MALTKREAELLDVLQTLAEQADEDLPEQMRTRHFEAALQDAYDIINHICTEEGL